MYIARAFFGIFLNVFDERAGSEEKGNGNGSHRIIRAGMKFRNRILARHVLETLQQGNSKNHNTHLALRGGAEVHQGVSIIRSKVQYRTFYNSAIDYEYYRNYEVFPQKLNVFKITKII